MKQLKDIKPRAPRAPVWRGPEVDGVTYSLLSRFLVCRDRFRALVVDGVKPRDKFDPKKEFGNMWHACEEALLAGYAPGNGWEASLKAHVEKLHRKYQMDRDAITHWYSITLALFPVYCEFWAARGGILRSAVYRERVFDVPYQLPSGRTVILRGKWDEVGTGRHGAFIGDHKTKSAIDVAKLRRQLKGDLQLMMYASAGNVALERNHLPEVNAQRIGEVRYNVIRRSAHKSAESMLKKCKEDIFDRRGAEWFERFDVPLSAADIAEFQRVTLDPVLESLCDWWSYINAKDPAPEEYGYGVHWRHPFGVWNPMDNGADSELDYYLESGSMVGLMKVDNLFPELS